MLEVGAMLNANLCAIRVGVVETVDVTAKQVLLDMHERSGSRHFTGTLPDSSNVLAGALSIHHAEVSGVGKPAATGDVALGAQYIADIPQRFAVCH